MHYIKRIYDDILSWRLHTKGAVLVVGAKWCGKTTTAKRQANSVLLMQNPATKQQNLHLAELDPSRLLAGSIPRLIDEWQVAPKLWDAVRYEVDERYDFGQFILTGSATPPNMNAVEHTGTGRIATMKMRTMSLFESGESTGDVSIKKLFKDGELQIASSRLTLDDIAYLLCRGGWPRAVSESGKIALQQAKDYVDVLCSTDISTIDEVGRSTTTTRMLLRSYARMSASQTSLNKVREDLKQSGLHLGETAFAQYIEALKRLFVIEELNAWSPNLRSKTAIRTTPTRHFMDPSIGAVALHANPASLINDLNTFGLLFETLCVRDLRVYMDALSGEVLHYRNSKGQECDAVVVDGEGNYGLIEIKLGGDSLIEEGAKSLLAIKDSLDPEKMKMPSFLMVLTAIGEYSYPRKDGVFVVPIGCLAP